MLTVLPNLPIDKTLQRVHLCLLLHTLLLPHLLLHWYLSLRFASSTATAPVVRRTTPATSTVPWPPRDFPGVALATTTTTTTTICTTASSLQCHICPGLPCRFWLDQPPPTLAVPLQLHLCRPYLCRTLLSHPRPPADPEYLSLLKLARTSPAFTTSQ